MCVLQQDLTTIMISMLRQMSEDQYRLYMSLIPESSGDGHTSHQNLVDFLAEILLVFKDLIKECVYSPDWNEMIMMQNKVFLKVI